MAKKGNSAGSQATTSKQIALWALKISGVVLGIFFLLVLFVYIGLFGKLPNTNTLKRIDNHNASLVYSIDGKIMGGYYLENRQTVANKEISKYVKNALVATEDSRFFEHNGLDFMSLGRVLVKTVLFGDKKQGGGSTISQQLAKNLFPRKKMGFVSMPINKIREAFIASRLEKTFSKEEILGLYLNTVPFGEDVYGIEAASQRFFNKKSKFLNPAEAATLVGMLAANTAYNPRLNPEKSTDRRNIVLSRMVVNEKLTENEGNKWKAEPMRISYNRIDFNTGLAPYFREKIRIRVQEILSDKYGNDYDVYTDGLRIYTTIDSRLQTYAEASVKQQMEIIQKEFDVHWKNKSPWAQSPNIYRNELINSSRFKEYRDQGMTDAQAQQEMKKKIKMHVYSASGYANVNMSPADSIAYYLKQLNVGFFALDAKNGHILAWVGGADHRSFPYDHVTSTRQVGSTFKPFVYAAALVKGFEPCDFFSNEQRVYSDYQNWSPKNSDGDQEGYYSLKGGLANSVNTVSAELIVRTGPRDVVDLAEKMGVTSKIPVLPSIALGAVDISLYDMVSAYSPFINYGQKIEPLGLLRIEDKNGKVLYKDASVRKDELVLDPDVSRMIVEMLKGVVDNGTGKSLRSVFALTTDLGGKTGTTQNNSDGWFIGFTPRLVAGAWVGNDNPAIRWRSTSLGQGAHTALPIFARFLKKVENDPRFGIYTDNSFSPLPDYLASRMQCPDFTLDDPNSKNVFEKLFGRRDKSDSPSVRNSSSDSPSPEEHRNLLDRMKDLFRKKD